MKWSKRKLNDTATKCDKERNISFNMGHVKTTDPIDLFYKFADFSLLCSKIGTESIRYALQNGKEFTCIDREIEVYFGITYFMGIVKLPSIRDYWRTDSIGSDFVKNSMSWKRYEEIRQNLHF